MLMQFYAIGLTSDAPIDFAFSSCLSTLPLQIFYDYYYFFVNFSPFYFLLLHFFKTCFYLFFLIMWRYHEAPSLDNFRVFLCFLA